MQRTSRGSNGGSPLILVLDGPSEGRAMRTATALGLRLVGACGLAMLGSGRAGAEAPRDAVQELVLKQVGTSPTVCARFKYDFIRGNKPTANQLRGLETCITDAWRRRQPFYFSLEGTGVDSH